MKTVEVEVQEELDVQVGQYVTVLYWEPYPGGQTDRSYTGDFLRVLAIDVPFVLVENYRTHSEVPVGRIKLDLRMVHLKKWDQEYVNRFLNLPKKGEEDAGKNTENKS